MEVFIWINIIKNQIVIKDYPGFVVRNADKKSLKMIYLIASKMMVPIFVRAVSMMKIQKNCEKR